MRLKKDSPVLGRHFELPRIALRPNSPEFLCGDGAACNSAAPVSTSKAIIVLSLMATVIAKL